MNKHYQIHFGYIISILVSIIVILITIKWGAIPKLVELISFSLTISSLVLAILAIVYAVYSNNSFGQNIAHLESSSSNIVTATQSLGEVSNILITKFHSMPELLEDINKKTDHTQLMLTQLSEKNLQSAPAKFIKSASIESDNIRNVVNTTSMNGRFILYALKLAKDSQKEFPPRELAEKCELSYDYLVGFISPLNALGLVKIKYIEHENIYNWQATDLHDQIYNNTMASIAQLWNDYKDKSYMHFVLDHINSIRIYFDLPPIAKTNEFPK